MAAIARTRTTIEPEAVSPEFVERILATVTALAERVGALEDRIGEVDVTYAEAVTELLRGLRGVGGSGVIQRSPVAAAIARDLLERKAARNGN